MNLKTLVSMMALLLPMAAAFAQEPAATAAPPTSIPMVDQAGHLAQLRDYRSMRVASDDRPGNGDRLIIAAHQTTTVAVLEGPGEITHLWTTIASPDPDHLRNIIIRIYWDGNDYPSVESPIGDFYGLGHAKYYYFDNPMQAIGTDKGMNCFWPMPFAKSARVEIENQGDRQIDAYYFYVDWRKFKTFPAGATYFHASYRQEFPAVDGKRYLIMETDGAPGHFAGVSLSIHTMVPGWWGEGDDVFTIDGEDRPSLWGTGSEDYFCGAWCYGKTFYNDYFGMPLRSKENHDPNNYWNVYRLHLESPITFRKSLKVEIEHGTHGFDNTRPGSNNNYASVAYWYQASPRPLGPKLLPAAQRVSRWAPPSQTPGVFEPMYMEVINSKGAETEHQNMGQFPTGKWHNNDHLWVRKQKADTTIELEFETTASLTGAAVLRMTKANDYGRVKVELDDKVLLKDFNGYSETVSAVSISVGQRILDAGKHRLKVTLLGKDDRASDSFWGLDYFRIGGQAPDVEGQALSQDDASAR